MAPPLVPFLYSEDMLRSRLRQGAGRYAVGTKGPLIAEERWPEVAARAKREGLRVGAQELGVSHKTVRSVLRSAARAESAV